jgi:hypothetical protein
MPGDRPNISQIIQRLESIIGAKSEDAVADWDESISSKSRRSLQEWPLLLSIAAIERLILGKGVFWHARMALHVLTLFVRDAYIQHTQNGFQKHAAIQAPPPCQRFRWPTIHRLSLPALQKATLHSSMDI